MIYHPDPTAFIAESGEYGALGKALVSLSNLEFSHDNFVFIMHKTNRDLSLKLSKKFPRHFKEKTSFLINAVANVQKLRKIPVFQTGELNLLWLQYQLGCVDKMDSQGVLNVIQAGICDGDRLGARFDVR